MSMNGSKKNMLATWKRSLHAVALALIGLPSAYAIGPAVNLVTAPLVAPTDAWTYYGTSTTHTVGLAAWSTTPPEIQAMATSLGAARYTAGTITATQYTQNVFDYVRNSIAVEFRFGLGKGGRGALIDQSGTPFDQAELMVKLLRAAGITAGYQLGTITLTPQQFGAWTGFVTGLNQSAQTFTVNAQAACQYLADGGIPAVVNGVSSCSSVSGNMTSVTLGHIWVTANSMLYDPSFKRNTLYAGIDLAAAMGCGSASAPTCGSGAYSSAMTNAVQGTLSGAPTLSHLNEGALQSTLQSYAVNLENYVKSNVVTQAAPYPRLQNVIGGYLRDVSYDPTPGASLPYTSATQYSWSGDIPDQFRSVVQIVYPGPTLTLYGDETAGRGIYFYSDNINWRLRVDTTDVFVSSTGYTVTPSVFNLVVNHPYAANAGAYADETIDFTAEYTVGLFYGAPYGTIVTSFGDSSSSTASHFADLQQSSTTPSENCDSSSASPPEYIFECSQLADRHLTTVSNFLAQQSAADQVIMNISATPTIRHHTIGMALGSSMTAITLDAAISANSTTGNAGARQAAYTVTTLIDATLEGSIPQQQGDVAEALSAPAELHRSNTDLATFIDVTSTNMATVLPSLTNYVATRQTLLSQLASSGYEVILPQSGTTSCAYTSTYYLTQCYRYGADYAFTGTSTALLLAEAIKGGESPYSIDAENSVLNSTRSTNYSLFQKKYESVDAATGTLDLSPPPDLTAGAGDFPYALPFQRTYKSEGRVGHWVTLLDNANGGPAYTDHGYQGPDSFVLGRLGDGWLHNYDVAAEVSNSGYEAFGAHGGLPATAAVSTLFALFDLSKTTDFQHRLSGVLGTFWFGSTYLMSHTVVIHNGASVESFQRLPDGSFTPLQKSQASLTQSGAITGANQDFGTYMQWSLGRNEYAAVQFTYTGGDGDVLSFNQCQLTTTSPWCAGIFPATTWTFPTGVKLQFTYQPLTGAEITDRMGNVVPCCEGVGALTAVSNNLGHSLTLALGEDLWGRTTAFPLGSDARIITSVTSDSGQIASFNNGASPSTCFSQFTYDLCNSFSVNTPDGATTTYGYTAGSDSPDPSIAYPSQNYRLRREFFPTSPSTATYTFAYDGKGRLSTVVDGQGRTTTYDPGGLYSEYWRRADVIDPTGAVTTSYFDDGASLLGTMDPLGRLTTYTYDLSRRQISKTFPEENYETYSYDIRSNLLSTTRYPKPGTGWSSETTSASYGEGPTVSQCVTPATCNKVSTAIDSKGNPSNFYYYGSGTSATGQLQRVVGPPIAAQTGGVSGNAQTDYCYTAASGTSGSVSLLTGQVRKVSSTENRVKAYSYYGLSGYLELQSATVDPATTLVPPAAAGGSCTTATKSGALALTAAFAYDGNGNLSSATDPLLNVTHFSFDAMRRLTTIAAPLNALTRECYDADGLLLSTNRARISTTDPNASTSSTTGQCSSAFPSGSWQSDTHTYSSTGEVLTDTDANGNVTTYAYDADSRQQIVQDGDGRQTATVYDAAGEVLSTWRGGSGWINTSTGTPSSSAPAPGTSWNPSTYTSAGPLRYAVYTYNSNGTRASVTDADGNLTTYAYDGFDRSVKVGYPDGQTDQTWYTLDGTTATATCSPSDQPCRTINRAGNYIAYSYDTMDRKSVKTPQSEGGYTYGYNLVGDTTAVNKAASGSLPAHSTTYGYDSAGRKSSEGNDNRPVSYQYDLNGNRTRLTWPDGYYIQYTYDALNRMTYAYQNGSGELVYYTYDPLSERSYACLGGQSTSCQAGGGTNRANYAYESNGDLSSLTHVLNSAAETLGFSHNHSHQITGLTSSDPFYLPIPVASSVAYGIGSLNQYTAIGGNTITTSATGNLGTLFPSSGAQSFAYDSENRLVSAAVGGSSTNTVFYDYDALERRTTKTVGGTALGSGGTTTNYLLSDTDEIAELDGSGNVLRRYIPGPRTDERIAVAEGSSTTAPTLTYFHVNQQDSVIAMTDSTGNAVGCVSGVNCARMSYDEYGNLSSSSTTTGEPYRFTGRQYDAETGLYYYRTRYYSPTIGRFLSFDSIGQKDDVNLYAYGYDDPLNKTDPSGQGDSVCGSVQGSTSSCDFSADNPNSATTSAQGTAARTNQSGAGAAVPAWKQFEDASAESLQKAGYTVVKQVRVTWEGAKDGAYAVIDAIGVKGKTIVLLEAKDGLTSKLSDAQKAIFKEAFKNGSIRLLDAGAARQLGLNAAETLGKQGALIASVNAASLGNRALGQFARIAAETGAIAVEVVRFFNVVTIAYETVQICGDTPCHQPQK